MQLFVYLAAYAASRKLHLTILLGVLRAPMAFFDTTPIGRIINRFAKDVDSIDSALPSSFSSSFGILSQVLITLIVLVYGSWFSIFALIPLAIVFAFIQVFFFTPLSFTIANGVNRVASFMSIVSSLARLCGIVSATSSSGLDDAQSGVFEFW